MNSPENTFENRRSKALNKCQASMKWYARTKRTAKSRYYASQVAIITLSALTPVLILIGSLPRPVQALPAALVAIAASLNNLYNWKENWLRLAAMLELLIAERTKYITRTTSAYDTNLDDQQALSNFVENMVSLDLREISEWQMLENKKTEKGK